MLDSARDSIKGWTNDKITIEGKGLDPVLVDNNCSYLMSNNSEDSIHIQYQDRKFAVIDMGKVNLNSVWPQDRITEFHTMRRESDEFAIAFPHWIIAEVARLGLKPRNDALITPSFYRLCEQSKPTVLKVLKSQLAITQSTTAKMIRSATGNRCTDVFLKRQLELEEIERKHKGIVPHKICEIVVRGGKINYESNIYTGENDDA